MNSAGPAPSTPWHALDAEAVAKALDVEATGLSDADHFSPVD